MEHLEFLVEEPSMEAALTAIAPRVLGPDQSFAIHAHQVSGLQGLIARRREFRDPDRVRGGTWEALERVLQAAGYHRGGLRKIEAARAVSVRMDPGRNRSRSFRGFVQALRATMEAAN